MENVQDPYQDHQASYPGLKGSLKTLSPLPQTEPENPAPNSTTYCKLMFFLDIDKSCAYLAGHSALHPPLPHFSLHF